MWSSTVPLHLFAYISKLVHLKSPVLILSEEESINADLCLKASYPQVCATSDSSETLDYLKSELSEDMPVSILLTQGDHNSFLIGLSNSQNIFGKYNLWVIPLEH